MTLSTRIASTTARLRRVHGQLSLANRRMFELTTGIPAPRTARPRRH
jgi:hypothetical protein